MRRQIPCMIMLILALSLVSCSAPQKESANVYQIYYIDHNQTALTAVDYEAKSTETEALIEELLNQFFHIPIDAKVSNPLDEKTVFQKYTFVDNVIYLYFDTNYANMNPAREILCRAGLVKTLSQIDNVNFVGFYAGSQPLTDSRGNAWGVFSTDDFIDTISNINALESLSITLYFSSADGQSLVAEEREITRDINTSLERLVIEELLEGPVGDTLLGTIPQETKIINITVDDSVCYVNFNETFLNGIPEEADYITIYSIVNSLSELSNINKVQILINGSWEAKFKDSISLNTVFDRNLDYVKTE